MKHWFIAGGVTAVVLMFATCNHDSPVIENNTPPKASSGADQSAPQPKQTSAQTHHHDDHHHDHEDSVTENEHLKQLSPEMKQAIKDKLLLHGPMEVKQHPDGSFSLPSKGRFTQMPVAVEMPDGSIQIREYSVIPDKK